MAVGKNFLENITVAMYENSFTICIISIFPFFTLFITNILHFY